MNKEEKEDIVTKENYNEQMEFPNTWEEFETDYGFYDTNEVYTNGSRLIQSFRVKQWLEHQMTAEEYRQRMIQAFHNANCDRLIAICALPTEKEFEHLEWLLKTHYKKESCEDAISRQAVKDILDARGIKAIMTFEYFKELLDKLPSVAPQPKMGYWHRVADKAGHLVWECDCGWQQKFATNFCPNCGAKIEAAKMEIRENNG